MMVQNRRWVSLMVLLVGICFLIYGVYRGEVDTVFAKAIRICLECIGIG